MKKLLLLLTAAAAALSATSLVAQSAADLGLGQLTLNLKVIQAGATNTGSGSYSNNRLTNAVTTTNYAVKSFSFNDASFLKLLGNAYGASFAGDSLAIDAYGGVYVVDKKRIILLIVPAEVMSFSYIDLVSKTKASETISTYLTGPKLNRSLTNASSGSLTYTDTGYASMTYDDSSILTNGDSSTFYLTGLATVTGDASFATTDGSQSYSLPNGAGYGVIEGTNSIISGSATGSAKFSIAPPTDD